MNHVCFLNTTNRPTQWPLRTLFGFTNMNFNVLHNVAGRFW